MAEKILYTDIFDEALDNQIKALSAAFSGLEKQLKDIQKTKVDFSGTGKQLSENEKAINDLNNATLAKLKIEQEQAKLEKIKQSNNRNSKKTVEELRKEIDKEANSLEELMAKNNAMIALRKKMNLSIEAERKEFDKLTKEIHKNVTVLKEHDKNIGSFTRNVGNYKSALSGIGASLTSIAAGFGIGLGVDSLIDLGREIVTITAKYEKYEAVLANTLGSQDKARMQMDMITELAAKTPYSVDQLTESYIKLVNRGFNPTVETMTVFGDIAASTGKDFNQLTEAVLDATTGEFERLKEFGIKAKKSGENVTFSFKGQQTTVKNTKDEIEKYLLSLGKAQGVSGAMAAISKTLEGRISNLNDAWEQMLRQIGEDGIAGASGDVIQFLTDAINNIEPLKQAITDVYRPIFELLKSMKDLVSQILGLKESGNAAAGTIEFLAKTLEITTIPLRALLWAWEKIVDVLKVVGEKFGDVGKFILNLLIPIDRLKSAMGFLGDVFDTIETKFDKFNAQLDEILEKEQKIVTTQNVFVWTLTKIADNTKKVDEATKKLAKTYKISTDMVEDSFEKWGGALEKILKKYNGSAEEMIGKRRDIEERANPFPDLFSAMTDSVEEGAPEIEKSWETSMAKLLGISKQAIIDIDATINAIFEATSLISESIFEYQKTITDKQIEETDKRIEALEKEYETEKDLQEERKAAGAAYSKDRLTQLEADLKKENDLKEAQEKRYKQIAKREALMQLVIDEAQAVSAAVKEAMQNKLNSETFGAAGIIQLASSLAVIFTNIQKYRTTVATLADGTEYVELNGNKPGIDTIPAMLNEGERVLTTEQNRQLKGIPNAMIPTLVRKGLSVNNSDKLEILMAENNKYTKDIAISNKEKRYTKPNGTVVYESKNLIIKKI